MTKLMKSEEFITKLKAAATEYNTLYVMGCFGAPLTGGNVSRYTANHSYNERPERTQMIRSVADKDYFGFDCVCLVKGILWGWRGDLSKTYGGAAYASNGVPDVTPEGMLALCEDVSDDFSGIVPGEFLWMQGHCGVYIGGGLAVECTPKWENKVQITGLENLGIKMGYNTRSWTKHGKLPYIEYAKAAVPPAPPVEPPAGEAVVSGDLVKLSPDAVYYDGSTMPAWVKNQNWYVASRKGDRVIINQNEAKTSAIRSPVNAKYVTPIRKTAPAEKWTPAVGDTVLSHATVHYSSADAQNGIACKGGPAKITQIYRPGESLHPYHLVRVSGAGATVYGWVDADTFTKA